MHLQLYKLCVIQIVSNYWGWVYNVGCVIYLEDNTVRRTQTFQTFINSSIIGSIVNSPLREGGRFLTELSSWLLPCLSALSHSAFAFKGIEGAISLPDLLSQSLSPAGFSAHFLHNCVKNEALWVSRNFPPFREGLEGGTPC